MPQSPVLQIKLSGTLRITVVSFKWSSSLTVSNVGKTGNVPQVQPQSRQDSIFFFFFTSEQAWPRWWEKGQVSGRTRASTVATASCKLQVLFSLV